jgi:DNA polymerase III subunit beta
MKLTIERAALLKNLAHAQSVVEKRNTIPILANILITAKPDRVSFAATDMDLEFVESAAAEVTRAGSITAPAHTLYDIVRKLPDGAQVELHAANSNQVTLSAGRSNFKLGCLPVEDFPQMSEGELKYKFSLSAPDLCSLFDRTRFAMSNEDTRYYLNGLHLHATAQNGVQMLRAVATDGHRLARIEMPAPQGAQGFPGIIIPRKTVQEVRKLLDEVSGAVEIAVSETKIRFAFNQIVLTSKLVDGTFPDYEKVIPVGNDKPLEVNVRAFAAAVDRVATLASEKTRGIKLSLAPGRLTISASSPEAGSASEELEAKYDAMLIDVGFNARYVLDITQQIRGDGLRLMLADGAAPVILQDVADSSGLYVIMPMRV